MIRVLTSFFLILFTFAATPNLLKANEEHAAADTISPKKFNTGDLIFDHIRDSYEWHIATIGHTHLSIPLPVMVYSQHSGFHFFMSGKLHDVNGNYDGFKVASEGKYERKLVEVMPDGTVLRPWDFSITKNVTSLFVSLGLILSIFLSVAKRYRENFARAPKGIQSWIEPIVVL